MLKKNYEFKQVLTRGKYYSGQYIKAFIIKNNKQNNFLGLKHESSYTTYRACVCHNQRNL